MYNCRIKSLTFQSLTKTEVSYNSERKVDRYIIRYNIPKFQ